MSNHVHVLNNGTVFWISQKPAGPLNYERINDIITTLKLGYHGFEYSCMGRITYAPLKYNPQEDDEMFIDLIKMIETFYTMNQSRKGICSRILKHDLEKGVKNGYVSNGYCILAFAYAGFEISKYKDGKTRVMNTGNANIHAKSLILAKNQCELHKILEYIRTLKKAALLPSNTMGHVEGQSQSSAALDNMYY